MSEETPTQFDESSEGEQSPDEGEGEDQFDFGSQASDDNPIIEEFGQVMGKIFFTLFATEEGETVISIAKNIKESFEKHNELLDQQNKILYKLLKQFDPKVPKAS